MLHVRTLRDAFLADILMNMRKLLLLFSIDNTLIVFHIDNNLRNNFYHF